MHDDGGGRGRERERGAGRRLVLINPNTNAATTAAMVAIAQAEAGAAATITGITAASGAPLITNPDQLAEGALAVAAAVEGLAARFDAEPFDGLIVAAFGDPGLDGARASLPVPVAGIAEAGMRAAACRGRFSVVTTTPDLVRSIEGLARRYGCGDALASVRLTPGDPAATMADPAALADALETACRVAVSEDRVDAIVIGGGPLAMAARVIAPRLPVPLIEPIPAAVAALLAEVR